MKKFEIRKGFEEIEIGGKKFKLDISDKALERFSEGSSLLAMLNEKRDAGTADAARESFRVLINGMFLDSPFDEIYAECGESIIEVARVMGLVGDYYGGLLSGTTM